MQTAATLSASLEDYLEAIYHIVRSKGAARSKDISDHLAVKGPSVTGALRQLASRGMVHYTPYDLVTLTPEGEQLAVAITRRHEILHGFLSEVLLLDEATAETTACQLEHVVRGPVLERLVAFLEFVKSCPRGSRQWHAAIDGAADPSDHPPCHPCLRQQMSDYVLRAGGDPTPGTSLALSDIQPGERARVDHIEAEETLRRRLLDMGLTPGAEVEALRTAPLGDPVEFRAPGGCISLRRQELRGIRVTRL